MRLEGENFVSYGRLIEEEIAQAGRIAPGKTAILPWGIKFQNLSVGGEVQQCGGCGARQRKGRRCEYCASPV